MKILISSYLLRTALDTYKVRKLEISHWLLTDTHLIFLNGDEQIDTLGIAKTLHCPPLKETPSPYIPAQWNNIRLALNHFPEQPIVMQFEEDKIVIKECELWFDIYGSHQQ